MPSQDALFGAAVAFAIAAISSSLPLGFGGQGVVYLAMGVGVLAFFVIRAMK